MSESDGIIVVKLGGSIGSTPEHFCRDAAALIVGGAKLVIVHGGSDHTNRLSEQLGHPPQFLTSPSGHTSRRTDRKTIEIMQMACRGLLNQQIVEGLQRCGVNAVGLSGMDGRLWSAKRKPAIRAVVDGRITVVRDDFTGTVERVNVELLRTLMVAGFIPVISPPAIGEEHEPLNVDADRAAGQTAAALGASQLLLLSNVPGLLAKFPNMGSLVPRISRGQWKWAQDIAEGRMKKKVMGATEALERGVGRVVIGDARGESPIRLALSGAGTVME